MSDSRKRLNLWPVGIIVWLAVFAAFLIGWIVFASFHRMELVTGDYYEQEIRYQGQMERAARARGLATPVQITPDAARRQLLITLPAAHAERRPEGRIHLYRPSAAGLDQQWKLEVDAAGRQSLDARDLRPGLWKVRIQWAVDGQEYFTDQSVVLGPRRS